MNKIKEARQAAGLTQKEMSVRFEIPKRTIENWETGERKPPAYVQKLIIEKLESMIEDEDEDEDEYSEEYLKEYEELYNEFYTPEFKQKCFDSVKEKFPNVSDDELKFMASIRETILIEEKISTAMKINEIKKGK